jgi:hypothetical protein
MAILGTFTKQPGERLDFDVDFSEWLSTTDTITSVVSVCDTGLTAETPLKDVTNKIVKQWITGGTTGTTYKVQITATTTEGRIKEAEFKVKVKEV